MGGRSSNGSFPELIIYLNFKSATFNHRLNFVLEIEKWSLSFSLILKSSPSFSVQTGKGKQFSELFDSDWKGKILLYTFNSILKLETKCFLSFLVDSSLIRILRIRKQFAPGLRKLKYSALKMEMKT
ncbi:hypothetical protein C1645_820152 [Glomus cerebriforme]|uniref:Uncharacterized protein n=1 Tax=Glomus cerebriforme TaxID=658196 RepID=A0A397T962_9GLOM|nr:hypothetical protein C1645_820152 [Glomus cerebriforme]